MMTKPISDFLVPIVLPHLVVTLDLGILKPKEVIPLRMISLRRKSFLEELTTQRKRCMSCPVFCQ